jgi:HK97 family phage major capsid protein
MGVTTANTVIELLKQGNVLGQLGLQVVSDMVGAFSLPKLTAGSSAQWVAEGESPAKSGLSIGAVGFAPKQLSAVLVVSRKSMKQSSVSLENLTRSDLSSEFAGKIEQTVLKGSGVGAEPEGLMYNAAIPLVQFKAGSGGGVPTWAKMLEFEQKLAEANVPGPFAFITTPAARAYMKQALKTNDGVAGFLWDLNNTINGYRAEVSNYIPKNLSDVAATDAGTLSGILFGSFGQVVLALWGGLDVIVDPFTNCASGSVAFAAHQDADVHPRHTNAFVRGLDMATV